MDWKALAIVAVVALTVVVTAAVITSAPVIATAAAVTAASLGVLGTAIGTVAVVAKVATVTLGVAVAINGANRAGEIATGTNIIRDKIMGGNEDVYNAFEATLSVASTGVIALGQMYSIPRNNPTTDKDIGRTGTPFSNTTMNKGYYNQTRFFDYRGNASLDIDFTNHPNSLTYHTNPHFNIWDNGIRSPKPMNIGG